MVSRYDTFKEEAEALATGYGLRLRKSQEELSFLERFRHMNYDTAIEVVAGSLVIVQNVSIGGHRCYLVMPQGGGARTVEHREVGMTIVCVSVPTPIGRALLHKRRDDLVDLPDNSGQWKVIYLV